MSRAVGFSSCVRPNLDSALGEFCYCSLYVCSVWSSGWYGDPAEDDDSVADLEVVGLSSLWRGGGLSVPVSFPVLQVSQTYELVENARVFFGKKNLLVDEKRLAYADVA